MALTRLSNDARHVTLISPAPRYFEAMRARRGPFARLRRLPRLALLALESVTPPAWSVDIVDERVDRFDPDAIRSPIVGITVMTHVAPRAFEMARALAVRGKTVVFGGMFPTLTPRLALAEPAVKAVVVGRAEHAWPKLLADFEQGALARIYDIPFGRDGFTLPQTNYALTPPARGYNEWITQVQAGTGCKFSCKFCVVPKFHRGNVFVRDPGDVAAEVARAPSGRIFFVDDNLVNRPAYLHDLCDRLAPLGKEWIAQVSLDISKQRKLIAKMAKAGCGWINVGIESIHGPSLDAQSKWQNDVRTYLETLACIRDHGMSVSTGIILGFPGEPRDVFDRTGEFLDKAAIDVAIFHLYTPYPGTSEYEEHRARGELVTEDLEFYDTYHAVVRPQHFAPEEVVENVERLAERFYGPTRIVKRATRGWIHSGAAAFVRTLAVGTEGFLHVREGLPLHP